MGGSHGTLICMRCGGGRGKCHWIGRSRGRCLNLRNRVGDRPTGRTKDRREPHTGSPQLCREYRQSCGFCLSPKAVIRKSNCDCSIAEQESLVAGSPRTVPAAGRSISVRQFRRSKNATNDKPAVAGSVLEKPQSQEWRRRANPIAARPSPSSASVPGSGTPFTIWPFDPPVPPDPISACWS